MDEADERAQKACARKTRYTTPEAAGRGASSAHEKGSTDKLRIYACPVCYGFHLTHLTLEETLGI